MRPLAASLIALALGAVPAGLAAAQTPAPAAASPLAGSWDLVAAEVRHADGSVARDYGETPAGRLIVDPVGRYSLQIFDQSRPAFAAGDKTRGTEAEYRAAVLGASTHFGTVEVDAAGGVLTFRIDQASFPNWAGTVQRRDYELEDGVLSYHVPPRPNGDVPITVWRRADPRP